MFQLHHNHKEESQLFLTYEDEILMNYTLVEGVYDKFGVFVDHSVMYDSYLLKDVHSVLVNFPREYAQESMMLYI